MVIRACQRGLRGGQLEGLRARRKGLGAIKTGLRASQRGDVCMDEWTNGQMNKTVPYCGRCPKRVLSKEKGSLGVPKYS